MFGVALPVSAFPADVLETPEVRRRVYPARTEGAEKEVRFLWREARPLLPVLHHSELLLVPWGNRDSGTRLPVAAGARIEDIGREVWRELAPTQVEIPVTWAYAGGMWFRVDGVMGVLVRAEGRPRVYPLTEPASAHYEVMTKMKRMPVVKEKA